ncbi:hypothetical protein HK104_011441 [Borealophlyctis nickersoniae]|nr:hypothetical protein HK104_011441 [Borealophlyctis nickersoniae]
MGNVCCLASGGRLGWTWEEDEIIMRYMKGQPSQDGTKLNILVPLMVKGNGIAWTAVALQPLNEEVWGKEEEMERLARERGIRLEEDYDSASAV